jgi:hypothetical protein
MRDYVVNIERRAFQHPQTNEIVARGFAVQVLQKVLVEQAYVYKTILDQIIAPFMAATVAVATEAARLYEILQKVTATVEVEETKIEEIPEEGEPSIPGPQKVETELSRGYCLEMQGVGDLLISPEGGVVFEAKKAIGKTIRITAPSQIILKDTIAKDIEVEAIAAIVKGGTKASIDSLHFKSTAPLSTEKSEEGVVNGLFIEERSQLEVKSLTIEDGLLLNAGRLTVKQKMDLRDGYFINTGTVVTTADPTVFKDISCFNNGKTGIIDASGKLIIGAKSFSNEGEIKAREVDVTTAISFLNSGRVEAKKFNLYNVGNSQIEGEIKADDLYMNLEEPSVILGKLEGQNLFIKATNLTNAGGEVVSSTSLEIQADEFLNQGIINGNKGAVKISGNKFIHGKGNVSSADVSLESLESTIKGRMQGQEIHLTNTVINEGNMSFGKATINGAFTNKTRSGTKFTDIHMTGAKAQIINTDKARLTVSSVSNYSDDGLIIGGEVTLSGLINHKNLQFNNVDIRDLRSIKVHKSAKLEITKDTQLKWLSEIDNDGIAIIDAATPKLSKIRSIKDSQLQINNGSELIVSSFKEIYGTFAVNAVLPYLRELTLKDGQNIVFLNGTIAKDLKRLTVETGGSFFTEERVDIGILETFVNYGTITLNSETRAASVHNGAEGILSLLNKFIVKRLDTKPRLAIDEWLNPRIQNDGQILVKHKKRAEETGVQKDLEIWGLYRASSEAVLQLAEGGSVYANDYDNGGTFFSSNALKATQHGTITKWGRMVARTGIELEVKGTPLYLSDSFITPVIKEEAGVFKIRSEKQVDIVAPTNMDVNMDIEALYLWVNSELKTKSLTVKGDNVYVTDKGDVYVNEGANLTATNGVAFMGPVTVIGNTIVNVPYVEVISPLNVRDLTVLNVKNFKFTSFITANGKVYVKGENCEAVSGKLQALGDIEIDLTGNISLAGGQGADFYRDFPYTYYLKQGIPLHENKVFDQGHQKPKTWSREFENKREGKRWVPDYNRPKWKAYKVRQIEGREKANPKETFPILLGHYPGEDVHHRLAYFNMSQHPGSKVITHHSLAADKASQIGSGGVLKITAKNVFADFGALRGTQGVYIKGTDTVSKKMGWIYSLGETKIETQNYFSNAFFHENPIHVEGAVDPNPIPIEEILPTGFYLERCSHTFHSPTFKVRDWNRFRVFGVIKDYLYYPHGRIPDTGYSDHGRIFSHGNVTIIAKNAPWTELGTIVSGGDIYINEGAKSGETRIGNSLISVLIARGNVVLEMERATLSQMHIAGHNIVGKFLESTIFKDCVSSVVYEGQGTAFSSNTPIVYKRQEIIKVDLAKAIEELSTIMGVKQKIDGYGKTPSLEMTIPYNIGYQAQLDVSVRPTKGLTFVGETPKDGAFVSTVHPIVLHEFIRMTLAEIIGRDAIINVDIVRYLESNGGKYERDSFALTLPEGRPMIVYEKSEKHEDFTFKDENTGEIITLLCYDPHLIFDAASRLTRGLHAENAIHIESEDKVVVVGKGGSALLNAPNVSLKGRIVEIISQLSFDRKEIDQVVIKAEESFSVHGKEEVDTKAVKIESKDISLTSDGKITDESVISGTAIGKGKDKNTYTQTGAYTSTIVGESLRTAAPKINMVGTEVDVKDWEVVADKYTYIHADTTTTGEHHSKRRVAKFTTTQPKPSLLKVRRQFTINAKDAKITATDLEFGSVLDNSENLRLLAPKGHTETYSKVTKKKRFLCFSSTTTEETWDDYSNVVPTNITIGHYLAEGKGNLELEAVKMKAQSMALKKALNEYAAYETRETKKIIRQKGWFVPKIKGDPLYEVFKGLPKNVTFGDLVPTVANVISVGAQTLSHATTFANLGNMTNPAMAFAQVLGSRYLGNFGYTNTKTTIKRIEKKPIQSEIDVGVLWINNDSTHLEGIWKVGEGHIETKKLTMTAPNHEVNQTVKSKGFSISANPISVVTGNLIPSGGIQKGSSKKNIKAYRPAVMSADKLYIRIGEGVLRGSTIKARLLEMIVDGSLTVETLKGIFKSESKNIDFAFNLGALFSEVKGERLPFATMDSKLGAVPTFRMASEKVLNEKVEHLAQAVGYEKFYLKVGGLLHDIGGEIGLIDIKGKVIQEGESCKIDVNEVRREEVKPKKQEKKTVINPSIGEIFACAIQIDEFKKIRHQFMVQRLEEGASMKQAREELEGIKDKDVDKVAVFKQRMLASQKKVAQKAKELGEKKSEVKVTKDMTQNKLKGEIMKCVYEPMLDEEVKKARIEQLSVMKEYEDFSKTLNPEVKSYFDRVMDSVGGFCHQFNDFMQRSSDITDMYLHLDDNLTDEFQRHDIKESIINREIRERRNNWLELAETGLRVLEFTSIASTGKVMSTATKEMKLAAMFKEARMLSNAKNFTSRLQLETKLAFEEAGILDKHGKLTHKAIAEAEPLELLDNLGNPELLPKLAKINPDINNWTKFETMPVKIDLIQANRCIHFYKHKVTGQTYFGMDYKVKEDVALNKFFYKNRMNKGDKK